MPDKVQARCLKNTQIMKVIVEASKMMNVKTNLEKEQLFECTEIRCTPNNLVKSLELIRGFSK